MKDTLVRSPLAALAGTRIGSHLRTPLFRNGYALLASSAATSALGLFYWVLAARYYPTETVGLGSALLSAMMLLSGIAQLSLNSVLVRFVPLTGRQTSRLIRYSYLISTAFAVLVSAIFLLGLEVWAPALKFMRADAGWQILFVVATVVWGIFALQDSALTGLRQALWIPLENTTFALAKIVLLVVLASSFQSIGIFTSWNLPVLISLLPINWQRVATESPDYASKPLLSAIMRDLPATTLRGYVQLETSVVTGKHYALHGGKFGVDKPHYLGPTIVAQKNRPVRITFYNLLPTGAAGDPPFHAPLKPERFGAKPTYGRVSRAGMARQFCSQYFVIGVPSTYSITR